MWLDLKRKIFQWMHSLHVISEGFKHYSGCHKDVPFYSREISTNNQESVSQLSLFYSFFPTISPCLSVYIRHEPKRSHTCLTRLGTIEAWYHRPIPLCHGYGMLCRWCTWSGWAGPNHVASDLLWFVPAGMAGGQYLTFWAISGNYVPINPDSFHLLPFFSR